MKNYFLLLAHLGVLASATALNPQRESFGIYQSITRAIIPRQVPSTGTLTAKSTMVVIDQNACLSGTTYIIPGPVIAVLDPKTDQPVPSPLLSSTSCIVTATVSVTSETALTFPPIFTANLPDTALTARYSVVLSITPANRATPTTTAVANAVSNETTSTVIVPPNTINNQTTPTVIATANAANNQTTPAVTATADTTNNRTTPTITVTTNTTITTNGPTASPTAGCLLQGCSNTYKVVPGDTCNKIIYPSGISLDNFFKLNPKVDGSCEHLFPDQCLCLAA